MLSSGGMWGSMATIQELVSDVPGEWTRDEQPVGELGL